jgi:hypothetical protein
MFSTTEIVFQLFKGCHAELVSASFADSGSSNQRTMCRLHLSHLAHAAKEKDAETSSAGEQLPGLCETKN